MSLCIRTKSEKLYSNPFSRQFRTAYILLPQFTHWVRAAILPPFTRWVRAIILRLRSLRVRSHLPPGSEEQCSSHLPAYVSEQPCFRYLHTGSEQFTFQVKAAIYLPFFCHLNAGSEQPCSSPLTAAARRCFRFIFGWWGKLESPL